MKPRLQDVFERLEPPPGGLGRLRARMTDGDHRRSPSLFRPAAWVAVGVVAACVAVLVVLAALERPASRPASSPVVEVVAVAPAAALPGSHPAFVTLGIEPLPAEPVTVAAGSEAFTTLQRVPLADERVVFYLVATLARPSTELRPDP